MPMIKKVFFFSLLLADILLTGCNKTPRYNVNEVYGDSVTIGAGAIVDTVNAGSVTIDTGANVNIVNTYDDVNVDNTEDLHYFISSDGLYLRSSPSTDDEPITSFSKGKKVKIIEWYDERWAYVEVMREDYPFRGYMSRKYLSAYP